MQCILLELSLCAFVISRQFTHGIIVAQVAAGSKTRPRLYNMYLAPCFLYHYGRHCKVCWGIVQSNRTEEVPNAAKTTGNSPACA